MCPVNPPLGECHHLDMWLDMTVLDRWGLANRLCIRSMPVRACQTGVLAIPQVPMPLPVCEETSKEVDTVFGLTGCLPPRRRPSLHHRSPSRLGEVLVSGSPQLLMQWVPSAHAPGSHQWTHNSTRPGSSPHASSEAVVGLPGCSGNSHGCPLLRRHSRTR